MASELQKLMFSVSLLDNVTGPAGKIRKQMDSTASSAKAAFSQIGMGAAAGVATGLALKSMLTPAIEMDRALGEVKSLGVTNDALQELSDTALEFSVAYGRSATDFVRSSYDIQSAIAGLTGSELSKFTRAGGVLAAATKADTGTITDYMGTMYGIFKDTARQMGKAEWVEQLTGQTALAVQMFKTDGQKMSAAFANLGASATAMGRDLAEQMAVMGTLQATMSGSESATKYKAFLAGVGKAQGELGLRFTDSNGEMLGMVEILNAIKGKFGETLDVAEADALKKAFGTKEAVQLIQLLMKDTDGLRDKMNQLGQVKGMETAQQMAADMVDPWQQLSAGVTAVSTRIGQALLPVINPLVSSMANGSAELLKWTKEFPNITRVMGLGVVSILGLAAALAAISIASGAAKLAWAGLSIMGKLVPTLKTLRTVMIGVNVAMYANPVGLIVAGVVALGAAIGAAIYWWGDMRNSLADTSWGQPIVFMMDSIGSLFSAFGTLATSLFGLMATAATPFIWILEKAAWLVGQTLLGAFTVIKTVAIGAFSAIALVIGGVAKVLETVVSGITKLFNGIKVVKNTVVGLLNKIPGINIETGVEAPKELQDIAANSDLQVPVELQTLNTGTGAEAPVELRTINNGTGVEAPAELQSLAPANSPIYQPAPLQTVQTDDIATPTLDAPRQSAVPAGGVTKQISNAVNSNSTSSKQVHVGQIVTNQPAQSVEQEFLMMGA